MFIPRVYFGYLHGKDYCIMLFFLHEIASQFRCIFFNFSYKQEENGGISLEHQFAFS